NNTPTPDHYPFPYTTLFRSRKVFQEHHECDFSFEMGDIARFRVNVFVHRRGEGAVFRTIPTKIIPLEQLGMPPVLRQLCDKEKGDRKSTRLNSSHVSISYAV